MSILRVGTLYNNNLLGPIVSILGNVTNLKIATENDFIFFKENECLIEFSSVLNIVNIFPRFLTNFSNLGAYLNLIEEFIIIQLQKMSVTLANQLEIKFFIYSPIFLTDNNILSKYCMFDEYYYQ